MPIILPSISQPSGGTTATITNVCAEGLKKAGYVETSAQWEALLLRAEDQWMEEIKADVYALEKKLSSLQTTVTIPLEPL